MFKTANSFLPYHDARNILPLLDQEELFAKYTGVYPVPNRLYKSILRVDRNPGCRFVWHSNGILYFVDNVGINGKIYFNVVDAYAYLKGIGFKEALNIIIDGSSVNIKNNIKALEKTEKKQIDIRFTYKPWDYDNYFYLKPEILEEENVYLVDDYWIKSNDNGFEYNKLHNPKKTLTIAYYFPNTNHTKLYFPYQKDFKWYTNCNEKDVFGESKLDYYLESDDRFIVITKSQKDRLILDYIYGVPAIAPQNEKIAIDRIIPTIKKFKEQLILFDNDLTGQTYAGIFSEKYDIPWVNLTMFKDVYEQYTKLKPKLWLI